jgi:uncharacterized protein YidB (DUF937 family)
MATSKKEQEVFNKLQSRFPKLANQEIAQLMAVWQGEAPGFKVIKDEADPFYVSPLKNKAGEIIGTGADRWANTFKTASKRNVNNFIKELLPDEINKLAKKYKLDPKGEQVKQLAEENLSTYNPQELGSRWYQKQVDDRKSGILSKEQFKEKVFDVQYENANVRGLGAFQVTGLSNIVDALKKSGRTDLAEKVAKDPSEISKLRYDPEVSWDITTGWIENNLLNNDGSLKTKNFRELANVVNSGEEKVLPLNRAKKEKYYQDYTEKFKLTPAPKTSDQQIPYPVTPEAAPEFNSMEELLQSKGVMPTSSAPPVSDTYRMEGYNAPYKQTTEPVNINTEPTGLENPFLSVKNWWNSL